MKRLNAPRLPADGPAEPSGFSKALHDWAMAEAMRLAKTRAEMLAALTRPDHELAASSASAPPLPEGAADGLGPPPPVLPPTDACESAPDRVRLILEVEVALRSGHVELLSMRASAK